MENRIIHVSQKIERKEWLYIKAYLLPQRVSMKPMFLGIMIIVICLVFNHFHDFKNITTIEIVSWSICGIVSFICYYLYANYEEIVLQFIINNFDYTIFNEIDFYEDYFICKNEELLIVPYKKIRQIDDIEQIYAIRIKHDKFPIIFINKETYEARYALSFIQGKVKQ